MTLIAESATVVCTGSGRPGGLGEAILKRFAKAGCRLVVSDIGTPADGLGPDHTGTTESMERVVAELRQLGAEVIAKPCDVRDPDQVSALMQAATDSFGSLDVLINNAGVGYVMKHLREVTPTDWELVLGVNLTGAFLCTQAASERMIAQGSGGRIINIASQAAKSGFPHMAPYVASKHGMIGLTRSAAIDLGEYGITVNAICPNHVTTPLGTKQNDYFSEFLGLSVEQYRDAMRQRIPVGRIGLPEDTAEAAFFLASAEASFVTGEAWNISGGEEMH